MKLYEAKGSAVPASGLSVGLATLCSWKGFICSLSHSLQFPAVPSLSTEVVFTHSGEEDVLTLHLLLQCAVLIFCWKEGRKTFLQSTFGGRVGRGSGLVRKDPYSGNVESLSQLHIVFVQFTSHDKFMFHR